MKKTLLALGVLGTMASVAHAQSSVTLYGLIDAGFAYSNNAKGGKAYSLTSGNINGSRWGLRGAEDLGNGLKAIFVLENGFNIANGTLGQGSREFGRQAFVGLSSDTAGTVTMGRQYDTVVDNLGPLSLTGTGAGGTYFAHPFDNDNLDNSFRVNNSLKYQSVNYGGFKFSGMYAFSNAAGQFSQNRLYSFGATYKFEGLTFAAGYLQVNNKFTGTVSANTAGAVSTDSPFYAGTQRTYGGGVNYAFGPAVVGFVFSQTTLGQLNGIAAETNVAMNNSSARFTNYEVNGRYNVTPAWALSGAYTFTDSRIGNVDPKWNQVSLMSSYSLSKRTDVYVEGIYQKVTSVGNSGITADVAGLTASSTTSQVVATVGMRHRF